MDTPLNNQKPINNGPNVLLPDNTIIKASHIGNMTIPNLPNKAKIGYKFPDIKKSLLSISAICNAGGSAIFTNDKVYIFFNNNLIIKGIRDRTTRLWLVLLEAVKYNEPLLHHSTISKTTPITNAASKVLQTINTKEELIRFLYTTYFYPVYSTWIKAIKNRNYVIFPGLTAELVSKYLPIEMPTILGYLHKQKQCIRSTTIWAANVSLTPEPPIKELYTKIIPLANMVYIDQTGKFSIRSKSGNYYIIILYNYDTNTILGEVIPDRTTSTLQHSFITLFSKIKLKGYQPSIIWLDNKISHEHLKLLEDLGLKI